MSEWPVEIPWEVIAVRYGTRQTTKSDVYLNYAQYGEPDAKIGMDYFFWILRSSTETVVIDTGFSAASGSARGRTMTIAPAEALGRLGIDPAEVRTLILTHAHWDHTGNLSLFPNAQILMSRTEFEFIRSPLAKRLLLAAVMDEADNRFILRCGAQGRVTLLSQEDHSIPGILVRELPGHAPGQLSVIIKRRGGNNILSSDAAHYYEELERDWPFSVVTDLPAMYHSLQILRDMEATPGAVVVPGHDPEVMRRFRLIGNAGDDFAVSIS